MNAPLRVALIGYGFVGKVFHAPLIQATPGLLLHTVVSRDAGKVHRPAPGLNIRACGAPVASFREGLNNSPVLGDNSAPRLGR